MAAPASVMRSRLFMPVKVAILSIGTRRRKPEVTDVNRYASETVSVASAWVDGQALRARPDGRNGMSRRTGVMVSTALFLALSGVASAKAAPDCSASHIVQQGDTVGAIAKRCGLTVEALIAANPDLKDPARISIGQELILPVAAPAEAESADGDATPEGDAEGAAEGEGSSASDAPTGDEGTEAEGEESAEIGAGPLPAAGGASSDAAAEHGDAAATEGESADGVVDTSDGNAAEGGEISPSETPAGDDGAEAVGEEGAENVAEPLSAEDGASSDAAAEHDDLATKAGEPVDGAVDSGDGSAGRGEENSPSDAPAGDLEAEAVAEDGAESTARPHAAEDSDAVATEGEPVDEAVEAGDGSASGEKGEAPSAPLQTEDSATESSSDNPADGDDRAAPSEPEAADADASSAAELAAEGTAEEPRLYTVQPGDSLAR